MYLSSTIVLVFLWYRSCSQCSAEWIKINQHSINQSLDQLTVLKHQNHKLTIIPADPTVNMKFQNDAWSVQENSDVLQKTVKNVQYPSMQGFIDFLKFIKRTWLQNSMINIDEKVQQLLTLKDQLFKIIEYRYNQFWLSMDAKGDPSATDISHRSRRGLLDETNFNFPPETALLSINFLTFAVFLIKLVLQVVNIVKTRHYNLSGSSNVVVKF